MFPQRFPPGPRIYTSENGREVLCPTPRNPPSGSHFASVSVARLKGDGPQFAARPMPYNWFCPSVDNKKRQVIRKCRVLRCSGSFCVAALYLFFGSDIYLSVVHWQRALSATKLCCAFSQQLLCSKALFVHLVH